MGGTPLPRGRMNHGRDARATSLGVACVGRFEFVDEAGEEVHAIGFAGGGVVIHEVAAAPAEDFAHGGGGEVGDFGDDVARAEQGEDLVGIAEETAFERIDEERQIVGEAADDEVAGEADGFEFEAEAFGHEQVDDAEGERNAGAALEHLVDETVPGIGVVLDVAVETPLVKHHAVDDAAFFPRGGGFGDEFAAAGGDLVEGGAAAADVEAGRDGAGEEQRAGFEFVVQRADEGAEIGRGVVEFQLLQKPNGVLGESAIGSAGDGLEERSGGGAALGEVGEEGAAHRGTRIVEEAEERFLLG